MSKIIDELMKRLNAAAMKLGAHRLPVFLRKISADGMETVLRDCDRTKPHIKATVRFVKPPKRDADDDVIR